MWLKEKRRERKRKRKRKKTDPFKIPDNPELYNLEREKKQHIQIKREIHPLNVKKRQMSVKYSFCRSTS